MIQYVSAQLSIAVFQVFLFHSGYVFRKDYFQLSRKHIWWLLVKVLLLGLKDYGNSGIQHMIFLAVWLNHQLNFSAQRNQFVYPMAIFFGLFNPQN